MGFWSWLNIFRGAHRTPYPVPSAPPAPTRTVAVVLGRNQTPVPDAKVTLFAEAWTRGGTTNRDGYLAWTDLPAVAGSLRVTVIASGYDEYQVNTIMPSSDVEIRIGFPAGSGPSILLPDLVPANTVLALTTHGGFFRGVNGEYHTIVEATDFRLLARYLNGEDMVPVLQDRAGLGFNTVRVACMCRQMFDLNPMVIPDYDQRLPAFTRLLLTHGLRPEFVLFMDASLVMPNPSTQIQFFERVLDSLRDLAPYLLLELVNENDQVVNRIDAARFPQPYGYLASHGSNGSQAAPVRPPWRYETFHTNDAPEWWRKTGHNAMELSEGGPGFSGSRVPVLANENTRAPDRFTSADRAFDAAAAAALLCAGSCFHSVSGKFSVIMTEPERVLARAWVGGAQSIDLRFQDGAYRHATELEGTAFLRVYQRVLSSGDAATAWVRK
jgi:hypothetical protein